MLDPRDCITAKVILHSIDEHGKNLISVQINAHRWILAEINTHCMLARNYRSSRAVPTNKLIQEVRDNPAMPVEWRKNIKGMQAGEEMELWEIEREKTYWRNAAFKAANSAEIAANHGLAKQWVNRHIEPYLYVPGIITASEWENFFALRTSPHAQPEFRVLAEKMLEVFRASKPSQVLKPGQWHLPYLDEDDWRGIGITDENSLALRMLRKMSAARCARVTYKVFDADRKPMMQEDIDLHDRLLKDFHMSPFEHQATPDPAWNDRGKFPGFRQYRKDILGENQCFNIWGA